MRRITLALGLIALFICSPSAASQLELSCTLASPSSMFKDSRSIRFLSSGDSIKVTIPQGDSWDYRVIAYSSMGAVRAARVPEGTLSLPVDDLIFSLFGGELFLYSDGATRRLFATGVNVANGQVVSSAFECR